MVDPRFYEALGPISAAALAAAVGAAVEGDGDRPVTGVAPARAAGPGDFAYIEGRGPHAVAAETGVLMLAAKDARFAPEGAVRLVHAHPRAAFAEAARRLFAERRIPGPAPIDPSADIEDGAEIAPFAVIGPGARIGAGARIGPHVVIGAGVTIGRRSRVGSGASLECALVGDDVTILPGARIGQQGFGVAFGARGPVEVPHFGRVVIMDRALIGAGVAIDRGLFDDTTIGEDAKIDNLCQIAHNVTVGRGAIVAACAGISGSTVLGDGAVLAGRVGVADHRRIGAGATLAAGSAVMHDVPDGETWGGYPAKPIRRWLREVAWLQQHASAGKRDDGG